MKLEIPFSAHTTPRAFPWSSLATRLIFTNSEKFPPNKARRSSFRTLTLQNSHDGIPPLKHWTWHLNFIVPICFITFWWWSRPRAGGQVGDSFLWDKCQGGRIICWSALCPADQRDPKACWQRRGLAVVTCYIYIHFLTGKCCLFFLPCPSSLTFLCVNGRCWCWYICVVFVFFCGRAYDPCLHKQNNSFTLLHPVSLSFRALLKVASNFEDLLRDLLTLREREREKEEFIWNCCFFFP